MGHKLKVRVKVHVHVCLIRALFGVLPMVSLVILPMVPLVAGTIGLQMVPKVQLGEQMVPLALPLVPMVLPIVPLV